MSDKQGETGVSINYESDSGLFDLTSSLFFFFPVWYAGSSFGNLDLAVGFHTVKGSTD